MLSNSLKRGFPKERLEREKEPRIHKDEKGYFIYTLNENVKVHFEEFYNFLEKSEERSLLEKKKLEEKISSCNCQRVETLAYYRAKKVIVDIILKNIYSFYGDGENLGVIMTPWCFGTVMLEKVEMHKERIAKGEIRDTNIPEYPYFVIKYIDEIYKRTLLELFDFPEKAFSVRWQYAELLKRYAEKLTNINSALKNILFLIKNYNA
jgi:hypothetical protein